MLRSATPLPLAEREMLAAWLDFAACANAAFDHKEYCRRERRQTRRLLQAAGLGPAAAEYLHRLRHLERMRPKPGADNWQFVQAAAYRESIVRFSLGMTALIAHRSQQLDEAVAATWHDADLNLLFRIVMHCQIIDDVLDYRRDLLARLPSFLTASPSLPRALVSTRLAAARYADARRRPRSGDLFPLRAALFLVSTCTRLVLAFGRWRRRIELERFPHPCLPDA